MDSTVKAAYITAVASVVASVLGISIGWYLNHLTSTASTSDAIIALQATHNREMEQARTRIELARYQGMAKGIAETANAIFKISDSERSGSAIKRILFSSACYSAAYDKFPLDEWHRFAKAHLHDDMIKAYANATKDLAVIPSQIQIQGTESSENLTADKAQKQKEQLVQQFNELGAAFGLFFGAVESVSEKNLK